MNTYDKLFSIGEISKAVGITRRIILNYESKGLIKPDRKEEPGGNRYYSIDTLTKIRSIRVFQKLNLSLDEIRRYLDGSEELPPLIRRLEAMRDELNLSIEKLCERAGTGVCSVKEITLEAQTAYIKTAEMSSIAEKTDFLRNTALEAMKKHGTDTTKRMYFTEYNLSNPRIVSFCVAVLPESRGENISVLASTPALSLYHHGSYETISETVTKLIKFAEDNHLDIAGTCRHIYLEGPPQHQDKSKFVTQVVLPLKK